MKAVVAAEGSCVFLALEGAKLPSPSGVGSEEAFPLASGFYPTDLSAEMHSHRERWAYCHTQLKPSMPAQMGAQTGGGTKIVPMVGTFLAAETATVYVDGLKLTLRC